MKLEGQEMSVTYKTAEYSVLKKLKLTRKNKGMLHRTCIIGYEITETDNYNA